MVSDPDRANVFSIVLAGGEGKRLSPLTLDRAKPAAAILKIGDKKIPIPSDFQNTAHSPIHDKEGTARKLYDEGVPAEEITSELIAKYDEQFGEEEEESPEAWLYE